MESTVGPGRERGSQSWARGERVGPISGMWGVPTHTSYALLSSPWRPKYLSENADAGQKEKDAGLPEACRWAAPRRGGTLGTGLGTGCVLTCRANVCSQTPLNLRVSTQVISSSSVLAVGF